MCKMNCKIAILLALVYYANCNSTKITFIKNSDSSKPRINNKTPFGVKTTSTSTETPTVLGINTTTYKILKLPEHILHMPLRTTQPPLKLIKASQVREWADEISEKLMEVEKQVVRREFLLSHFEDIRIETRNGTAVVEKAAEALEELLERRTRAAENIARKAEQLFSEKGILPSNYIFDTSIDLGQLKKIPPEPEEDWEIINNCSSLRKIPLKNMTHFGNTAEIELDISSVKVALEVFECDKRVLQHIYWTEGLLHTFRQNYAQDALTDFQYFCSASGFLRHYPAASWASMFKLNLDDEEEADVYDCRLRPWYVAAGGAPRDVLILLDSSGSMVNSSNKVNAIEFTQTLLNTLTDDDQVNVIRFSRRAIEPVMKCFNEKLVPANHVNTAALMGALRFNILKNQSTVAKAIRYGVRMLQRQHVRTDKPKACQQVLIVISDAIEENYTSMMRDLDPSGNIRLFVIWLHDVYGFRDHSSAYGRWLSCTSDGELVELLTHADVTEQVMRILRVLDRPLVSQRKERLRVYSDVYAHVEDPRRADYHWQQKENAEQAYRYRQLRKNKDKFMSPAQLYMDFMHQESLNEYGQYYEGTDLDYRLQISVSVPVFEDTTVENITIMLMEEKQRNSTRTYPVNRLLGVAGVDIPVEHLKLSLPYHQLGAGGSLFIIDHRGNIILHDNLKPVFDGDLLRPGYRTVDILDLEQSATEYPPRNYSTEWLEFRKAIVIDKTNGSRRMFTKNIFANGMRAQFEEKEYFWRRVHNHYTIVVAMPMYSKKHAVPEGKFTQEIAEKAYKALKSEHSLHPDWLYCRHVDQFFDERELEVRHFILRRKDEPNFKMQNLYHEFSPFRPTLLRKTYLCNEELMARLCKEAIATEQWAEEHEDEDTGRVCDPCDLGSVTAFFASESGLTRWQQYHMASAHASPPAGSEWPRGPSEDWYRRAAASPDTLVIHAPVTPIRKMRNSDARPPPHPTNVIWLTAARTLGYKETKDRHGNRKGSGMIGVAGYHFYPQHLDDVLKLTTNRPCPEGEECDPRCDDENWKCVLIDEGGWLVSGYEAEEDSLTEDTGTGTAREHLARIYPHAMRALLDANIFQIYWVHDYQGICFPSADESVPMSATRFIPSIIKAVWYTVNTLIQVTKELVTIIAWVSSGVLVAGETFKEKEKRRKRLRKDYERELFERLYDEKVLVNRTRIAACDRSRPLYQFQDSPRTFEKLRQPVKPCSWPLVGARVKDTNLVLLAIYLLCPFYGRPVSDPFVNQQVDMKDPAWEPLLSASRLACWRNRMPLPIRAPHSTCFPHNYEQEAGYRQCGEWVPDPDEEPSKGSINCISKVSLLLTVYLLIA